MARQARKFMQKVELIVKQATIKTERKVMFDIPPIVDVPPQPKPSNPRPPPPHKARAILPFYFDEL